MDIVIAFLIPFSVLVTILSILNWADFELNRNEELRLGTLLGVICVSSLPVINLVVLVWFVVGANDFDAIIYRRDE